MRKIVSFVLFGFILLDIINAKPVNVETAQKVAVAFMKSKGYSQTDKLVDVTAQTSFREFYIFAAADSGFVLVSADDCVVPILGYSTSSHFETKEILDHVREWLDDYESGIRFCRENFGGNEESDWSYYLNGTIPSPLRESAVSPLLTTTWNQSPYYNNQCPYDNSYGRRAVCGCVATATAQIMKYWNHPASGYGSYSYTSNYGLLSADFNTTYAWSSMPNSLSASSSSAQVNAVAKLIYHVGVAVEMDYTANSSGAYTLNCCADLRPSTETALMQYFKYRPDMVYISKSNYTDAQWSTLLRTELDQSRPILYSGRDASSGHAFVCDGYNNNGMFHFNWGWGGYCDGYYTLGALNPSSGGTGGNATYTFNLYNQALLGIRPNTNWNTSGTTTVTTTTSGGTSGCTVSGAGSYSYGSTITLHATNAPGCTFTGWSDGCKCNPRQLYANGGSYSFTAQFSGNGGSSTNYTITTLANSSTKGTVAGGGSYASGTSVTLTALPKSGYRFDHWQDGNKTNPRTITVTNNSSYTAYFVSGSSDTLAYCEQFLNDYLSLGFQMQTQAIKFLPAQLSYRNYLKGISIYSSNSSRYTCAIKIYQGGENAPGTLIHTQYASYSQEGWNLILLDHIVPINTTQNLWITIEGIGGLLWGAFTPYSAFSGDDNSNWYSPDGEVWQHLDGNHQHSWMIKAVTTYSTPTPAPPTVIIDYDAFLALSVAMGTPVPFSARGTTGGIITWTFQHGTPSTATGASATSTWNDHFLLPHVIASISNQYGSSSDTIRLLIEDCGEPRNAETWISIFDKNHLLPCWTLLDNDGDGFGWTKGDDCISSYSRLNYYGALSPDNWLITPLLHIPSDTNYYLKWYEITGSTDSYGLYVSTTGNNPEDFVLLQNFTPNPSVNMEFRYWDLSAYRNQDVYIAFRHYNVTDGTCINLGTMNTIKGNLYMVSVTSNNGTMGTVTGGGYYPANKTAFISAKANEGYRFVRWSDGNTQADRLITVTGSTSYVAYFESTGSGVEDVDNDIYCQLNPNPANESATLVLDAVNGLVNISIVDVFGHVLTSESVSCSGGCIHQINVKGLAKGLYFVRINTSSRGIVRKLIVE